MAHCCAVGDLLGIAVNRALAAERAADDANRVAHDARVVAANACDAAYHARVAADEAYRDHRATHGGE